MYEELDREKYENPTMDLSQRRSLRIREVVDELEFSEKIEELESMNNQMGSEIVFLKAELQIAKNLNDRKQDNTKLFSCKYWEKFFVEIQEVKDYINALSFYRFQNVLCRSKFFEPAQKFDCI